ncbi:Outer membrane lipoprotein-sorting protein [Tangfeifania diversioriginum]|uniref:Outer membrane lipoprotein-sorting protein n=1 Tax=Tangfeifania diversioriginum TaxID=1168035 RepID=A0A1M6CR73_9BACT|nr:outer membrane lipoprotein carrier protein LolA [Tangfeifania diversioriginum]SHI63238.1 Outer membrane lipoprotein-sorting protein [Tangfeifania diversioriginum]
MKRIFFIGIIGLIPFLAVAQNGSQAKQILNEVSEKTQSYNTISASFIFSMDNEEMEIHEKNEGSIQLKGQRYVVDLPDVGMKVYSDGETLWNYMEDGNQVTISNIEDNSSELMDPSSIFSIYEKGFESKYIGEKQNRGKTLYQIELYPDTDAHDVSKIVLFIDKSNMMINSAVLHGTDGNLYGIEVTQMNIDTELTDDYFVFDASNYGDIEIIDFR